MSDPYSTIAVDFQEQTTKYSLSIYNGTTPIIRVRLYNNAQKFIPTSNYTAELSYNNDGYEFNTSPSVITGVISTTDNYVDFPITNEFIGSNSVDDYFTQVVLYSDSKNNQYVFGDGTLHILRKMDSL